MSAIVSTLKSEQSLGALDLGSDASPFADFPINELESPSLTSLHYVLCNEMGQGEILSQLTPSRSNGMHLGFACWMNFDILAERNTPYAILCDYDENMIALLNLMKKTILQSNTPEEFMCQFWDELSSREELNFTSFIGIDTHVDRAQFEEQMREKGWLSTPEKFQFVKEMYLEGRILHRQLNVADTTAFDQLKAWADSHRLVFDTIYTSNIPEWLFHSRGDLQAMMANVERLMDPQSIAITAQTRNQQTKEGPTLHLGTGEHPELRYRASVKQAERASGASRTSLFT